MRFQKRQPLTNGLAPVGESARGQFSGNLKAHRRCSLSKPPPDAKPQDVSGIMRGQCSAINNKKTRI